MRPVLFVLVLIVISCKEAKNVHPQSAAGKESKYKSLLTKFKDISFDTLHVYSPTDYKGPYMGKPIDPKNALLFPKDISDAYFNDSPGIFAVYKFSIDKNKLGLIARTPSEYWPSSIKLFFFDKKKDTITGYTELAQNWGDAGDAEIKDTWLFKNKDKKLNSFMWVQQSHDNSVDNEKDTTVVTADYYYLFDLSKYQLDTLSENKEQLGKTFKHIIKNSGH